MDAPSDGFGNAVAGHRLAATGTDLEDARLVLGEEANCLAAEPPLLGKVCDGEVSLEYSVCMSVTLVWLGHPSGSRR